jgi:hypothetical protein
MGAVEKLKDIIDWLRRGYFIVELFLALGFGTAMRAVFTAFTHIPSIWITPIWLAATAAALAIIIFVGEKMAFRRFTSSSPLRKDVVRLGEDLFAFLREIGPEPENPRNHYRSAEDVWKRIRDGRTPYEIKVHHGYLSRFKDRAVNLFHELAIAGIDDPEITDEDIDPPRAVEPDTVRKLAAHMFIIVAKMDIKEASKGT